MKILKKVLVIVALLFTSVLSFWHPLKNVNALSTGIHFPSNEWVELNIGIHNYHIYKGIVDPVNNTVLSVNLALKNDLISDDNYFLYVWQRYNVEDTFDFNDGNITKILVGNYEFTQIISNNNSQNLLYNFGYADNFISLPNVEFYNSTITFQVVDIEYLADIETFEFYVVLGTNKTTLDYLIGGYEYSIGYGAEADYQLGYNAGFQDGSSDGYNVGFQDGSDEGYSIGYAAGRSDGYTVGFNQGMDEARDMIFENGIEDFTNGSYKQVNSYDYLAGYQYGDYYQGMTDVFWKGLPTDHPLHGQYPLSWWYNHNVYYEGEYYDNPFFYEIITSTDDYHNAYSQGYSDAMAENPESVGFFGTLFSSIGSFLSIEILPNISFGLILAVPLIFGIISFLIGKGK